MSKKWILIASMLLIAVTAGACQANPAPAADAASLPPAGIIAQGHVEPVAALDVAFTVSGQVLEVLVAEGDTVTSGQILARLSGGELRALEIARAEQELLASQQFLADLQADPELVKTQAEAAAVSAEKALVDTQEQLNDLKNPDPVAIAQLEARIALLEEQRTDAQEDLLDIEDLTNPDELELALARSKVADLEKSLAEARQSLSDLQNPDPLQMAQIEASLPLLEAKLAAAKTEAEALTGGVDADLVAAAQTRLATAQAALASAQANAAALELRAPMAGTIVGLNLQPGQVISAGLPGLTIADLTAWIVETDDLTEIEVVSVAAGEAVTVVLDALPAAPISGTVRAIAQRFEDRRGDVTYRVTITLGEVPADLRWGMTGQVQFPEGK